MEYVMLHLIEGIRMGKVVSQFGKDIVEQELTRMFESSGLEKKQERAA